MRAVADLQHVHRLGFPIDAVHDAVVAAADCPSAFQLLL